MLNLQAARIGMLDLERFKRQVNECLMQSWDGTIRLFPNWPRDKDARFQDLQAAGAFLVSASQVGGSIGEIRFKCEAGGRLNLLLPWRSGATIQTGSETLQTLHDDPARKLMQ
jgi:hypothetical protein